MIDIHLLPHFQASMNVVTTVILCTGFYFIKNENKTAHRACMVAALCTSALFLVSYLYYHWQVGTVKFQGQGFVRPVYYFILITHTVLAAVLAPMVIVTVYRAFKENFEKHKAIARWTLPVWLYVSVTGVTVYVMLYHVWAG